MDRRYSQSRFYDGSKAVRTGGGSDALVRRYLGEAKRRNHAAQSYGTSAPKGGGVNPSLTATILAERALPAREQRQIYELEGSGIYGARAEIKRARRLGGEENGG